MTALLRRKQRLLSCFCAIVLVCLGQPSVHAQVKNPDLDRLHRAFEAAAAKPGGFAELRNRVWQVQFHEPLNAGENVDLEIYPIGAANETAEKDLQNRLKLALKITSRGPGAFTVELIEPKYLYSMSHTFIGFRLSFRKVSQSELGINLLGRGDSTCTFEQHFYAPGSSEPLSLINRPHHFRFIPQNAENRIVVVLAPSATGQAVFRRLNNQRVDVQLIYQDPSFSRDIESRFVTLGYCGGPIEPSTSAAASSPPPAAPAPANERGGFYWGIGGHAGVGVVTANSEVVAGLALGPSARVGYFFNRQLGLYFEPRFSMAGQNNLFAYSLGGSVLLQACLFRHLVLALGPSLGLTGNNLAQSSAANFGGGGTARIGVDLFLRPQAEQKGPRAFSIRVDAQPVYYLSGGLLTTVVLMLGYESY